MTRAEISTKNQTEDSEREKEKTKQEKITQQILHSLLVRTAQLCAELKFQNHGEYCWKMLFLCGTCPRLCVLSPRVWQFGTKTKGRDLLCEFMTVTYWCQHDAAGL